MTVGQHIAAPHPLLVKQPVEGQHGSVCLKHVSKQALDNDGEEVPFP